MVKLSCLKKLYLVIGSLVTLIFITIGFCVYVFLSYDGVVDTVTFKSEDVQLAGVLVKPNTSGPHPGIVLLHGSGSQTSDKWFYRIHTNIFVHQGFAVLSYDKRGSGDSEGNLKTTTFQDLIQDGVAAVEFLRNQPDVRSDQIGIVGVSESGWFSPEIAARAGNISFLINRTSSPLSWRDTVLFEVQNEALQAGFTGIELKEVLKLQNRIWQFYIDSVKNSTDVNAVHLEEINTAINNFGNRLNTDFFSTLPPYNEKEYAARISKLLYDPYPFLLQNDIPMFYILAGKDVNIPFMRSIDVLEQLRDEYGKPITLSTYPDAGHYLYRWDLIPLEGFYVSGYAQMVGEWAVKHIR